MSPCRTRSSAWGFGVGEGELVAFLLPRRFAFKGGIGLRRQKRYRERTNGSCAVELQHANAFYCNFYRTCNALKHHLKHASLLAARQGRQGMTSIPAPGAPHVDHCGFGCFAFSFSRSRMSVPLTPISSATELSVLPVCSCRSAVASSSGVNFIGDPLVKDMPS